MLLVIAAGALLIVAIVVAIAPRLWNIANAHSEDPVVLPEFEPLAQRTYVYDADGNEIAVYELENSQPIKYADIPEHVVQAFLVIEDKEFFTHDGVNVRRSARLSEVLGRINAVRPSTFEVSVLDSYDEVADDPSRLAALVDAGVDRVVLGISAPHDPVRLGAFDPR